MAVIYIIIGESLSIMLGVILLLCHRKNFLVKRGYWAVFPVALILNFCFSKMAIQIIPPHFNMVALFFLVFIELKLMYKMNLVQILFETGYYVSIIYWGTGIIRPSFALFYHNGIDTDWYTQGYFAIAWILSMGFIIVYHICFRKFIAPVSKIKKLYNNGIQLWFAAVLQVTLLVYITLIDIERYYKEVLPWMKLTYISSCVICLVLQMFIVKQAIKISSAQEHKMSNKLIEQQLVRQLQHYNAYQKYTQSFRSFKHDYKSMMASVNILLAAQEYEKAKSLLNEIHDTMQEKVLVHKSYSNHIMLDAIFQETANQCAEHGINFSTLIHIPDNLRVLDINLVRIFTNICSNAVEACLKVHLRGKCFIEISSSTDEANDWVIFECRNSFSGEMIIKDGKYQTTKAEKSFHGVGLSAIEETAESVAGMMHIDVDYAKKIFNICVMLPIYEYQ